jgi:hypothetical protein
MIKSIRILAGHVVRLGRRGTRIGYWWESQKVDNIRIDLGEIILGGVDWIRLTQDTDK